MSIMRSLAVRQLIKNKKRTVITIIGIMLSVAMITAVAGFVVSTRDMLRRVYIETRGDYHILISPVTEAQARLVSAHPRVESSYKGTISLNGEESPTIFFRVRDIKRDYAQTARQIAADAGITSSDTYFDANKELLAMEGVIASSQSLLSLYTVAAILGSVILLGSVIVIANAFYISASERMVQFGVLKSVGATKEQIRASVLSEGIVLSAIAIPLGILAGFIVEFVALSIANHLLADLNDINVGSIYFKVIFSGWAVIISAILSFVTVLVSAWLPASRAAKISAIEAIKLSDEVKIKPRAVKVSPIIKKLFGFEGSLASKALKRSRRKYRATVISLIVSIVLFVLGSGFGTMMMQSVDLVYTDYDVNVIMQYQGATSSAISAITSKLGELPGEMSTAMMTYSQVEIPIDFYTADSLRYTKPEEQSSVNTVILISVNDAAFAEICRIAGLNAQSFGSGELSGILHNVSVIDTDGKRIVYRPFDFKKDIMLTSESGESFKLLGEISDNVGLPAAMAPFFAVPIMKIILPESSFSKLIPDTGVETAYWLSKADDPAAYSEAALDIFNEIAPKSDSGKIFVSNYEQAFQINKNLNLLFMIFIYGFIAMLTFIAVTSVLSTISTNITLRIREFAMLSSVGMTPAGLRRMLNLESLFYGLRALFIGIPVSLVLYRLLYKAFAITFDLLFVWPWQSIIISAVAVMLITFATMRYSVKMLEGKNIVEMIKKINI